ncbi:nickel ABC transporter ATP-binding protein NikE [Agrobacterium tumefaciens]|uniref:nickel ABC transporter ATP-binding protein NikE n=1 Tax=Agrobacterium tumefaciens TaxID=358 RepID=UPI0022011968|nr:ABC transporter ATP-binding protein [Agrobacterium tumefaciens]
MTQNETAPLIDLQGFGLGFATPDGFRQVLHDVSVSVRPGEMVGLVGESGSGKTVTAKFLLGILPGRTTRVVSGTAHLLGHDLRAANPRERENLKRHIAYVPQDPMAALNPSFTIGSQMIDFIIWDRCGRTLARYLIQRRSRKAVAQARDYAGHLLDMVNILDASRVLDCYPVQLSGGMRQRVLLALAMSSKPRLLIADEPTTALDVTVQKYTVELIQALVESEKLAGLYITHDLGVARWLCARSYVMLHGKVVETAPTRQLLDHPQDAYTQRLVAAIPRMRDHVPERVLSDATRERPALRVQGLVKTFGPKQAVNGVSFDVRAGETFAIVGESGSGKSTVAQMLTGLMRPTDGTIHVNIGGLHEAGLEDRALFRNKIQMVFQDPGSSLNPRQTVEQIVGLPLVLRGMTDRKTRLARVEQLLDDVALSKRVLTQTPRSLSGGQKQRVSIARALAMEPEILVLDEPTSALDVSVQAQILALLRDLRLRQGLTYLLISHDLGVVRSIADRIAVMYRGEIVEMGKTSDVLFNPTSDYTRALIAAVPALDTAEEEALSTARNALADGGCPLPAAAAEDSTP